LILKDLIFFSKSLPSTVICGTKFQQTHSGANDTKLFRCILHYYALSYSVFANQTFPV
jgi:hypothetical protein